MAMAMSQARICSPDWMTSNPNPRRGFPRALETIMLNRYPLPTGLVARMESLATDTDEGLPDHDITMLMCEPPVTFDGDTRCELARWLPRGSIHDDTVAELLRMAILGKVRLTRHGVAGFYFERA